jgi:hypothetical protein
VAPIAKKGINIMNYTVSVNESNKEIKVMLDGYEGVAKCCPTDNFNLGTGIELALERAKVAKANANKPKPTMSVSEAIKVLEEYAGGHIIVIGGGDHISESQKEELRRYADMCAPTDEYDRYEEGYADGYAEGTKDTLAELECDCDEDCDEKCECDCHNDEEVKKLAKVIIKLIEGVMD